ncbi:MAG: DUF1553 domain-containing protein, partial [Planctomycetes bacterium]|nr:DUF1553 domain-containing protein [Planctomycetota bacterium]
ADSRGYGSDPLRPNMWLYRDWVIDAFNRNLPFDRFTIEQIAGDLLPQPSQDQLIATGFHRNTMTNTEGGTDDEEFRVAAVFDRVDTTIQVWMGLTMGCAKCHSHKYDPISQKEYYQVFAIFNQTADTDRPDEFPVLTVETPEYVAALKRHKKRLAALSQQIEALEEKVRQKQTAPAGPTSDATGWQQATTTAATKAATEEEDGTGGRAGCRPSCPVVAKRVRIDLPGKKRILSLAEVQVFSDGKNVAPTGVARQSSTAYQGEAKRAIDGNTDGDYFAAKSTTHTNREDNPWWQVELAEAVPVERVVVWNRTDGKLGTRLAGLQVSLFDGKGRLISQESLDGYPNPRWELKPRPLDPDRRRLAELRAERTRLQKNAPKPPTVPIMRELPPDQRRTTRMFQRGNFLTPGEPVGPGVLSRFHPFPNGAPLNRLGLALWLVDRSNPLTARVAVNRFWAQLFGRGLVETEEDFGTQGEPPTHPELLDWLAVEFMKDWDIKRLLKLIVTSATYRQSSRVTPELLRRDPHNRLLARGPRFRLPAEMIRDQALALSGLLSRKRGGPSVYPYQPPGLWRAAFNGQRKWPTSQGEDRYRRALYTFWRRTVPYPSLATFDMPSREMCTIRRPRTNTPLQAFVTLNDPTFFEAAQALARRIVSQGGTTIEERLRFALRLCLCRPPTDEEVAALRRLYRSEREHYGGRPQEALATTTEPLGPLPDGWDPAELAAWTIVANVLLNLDAVLTKG